MLKVLAVSILAVEKTGLHQWLEIETFFSRMFWMCWDFQYCLENEVTSGAAGRSHRKWRLRK